jgi:hypothetical protein
MENRVREQRVQIEMEYLGLILHRPDIIDLLQIKPKYLIDKEVAKLLQYSIESYTNNGMIHPVQILELHKDFNMLLYTEIYTNSDDFPNSWKVKLEYYEDFILKAYKEDTISSLNLKLDRGEINYNDFVEEVKKLDELQLIKKTKYLDEQEIIPNIDTQKIGIYINNYKKLNDVLNLVQGDFLIVGATTGGGKSGFLLNLMNGLMGRYQCIYFNMEMSKSTIYKRMISINTGVPINDITEPKSVHQQNVINNAISRIAKAKVIIEHEAADINSIKKIVSQFKDDDKHTIIFIDHIGLTKCDDKKSIYEATTHVVKQLRQLCVKYNCTIIAASQMNRSAYGSNELTLNMLKDSGEVENSSSKTLLLYLAEDESKENVKPRMVVDVAKNRDGKTGIIYMEYDKTKQIFKEEREW